MRIHILGICGTFMGGLALLARQLGHEVSGSDNAVYPPMSTQLTEQGIALKEGYKVEHLLEVNPEIIIVGNTMSRGKEVIEYILNNNLPYISGPQWLHENILKKRHVLAVAGTHGKTTTTGMLSWILHYTEKNPGFLCGGIPKNFGVSANLGDAPFFVIEADEYDTAFFDKRSKFVHYCPQTLIVNNIEFDHADIFPDLTAIKRQFHHLVRLVPGKGTIIHPFEDVNVKEVLMKGCWTPVQTFSSNNLKAEWQAQNINDAQNEFAIYHHQTYYGTVKWQLSGIHNINNALAAIAAAHHIGLNPSQAITALTEFTGIKRRLELVGQKNDITIYDDFAHHPTAIATTIKGLRAKINNRATATPSNPRIIAAIELGSNSMRAGAHGANLITALNNANIVFILQPQAEWDLAELAQHATIPLQVCNTTIEIIAKISALAKPFDNILIMSNKSFDGIQEKLLHTL